MLSISINAPLRDAAGFAVDGKPFNIISINAPLRSATKYCCRKYKPHRISINAPLRSATGYFVAKVMRFTISINAPLRSATSDFKICCCKTCISINAPLRSATIYLDNKQCLNHYFNQRTPTECDIGGVTMAVTHLSFQSTHPYGVRRASPLARLGGAGKFQSTHPYGVRQHRLPLAEVLRYFNQGTPTECDKQSNLPTQLSKRFQSTHPYGVRLKFPECEVLEEIISINAPLRSATG